MTESLWRWKNDPNHKALVIWGQRQIGKTYIIDKFGRENYRHYLRLDFSDEPELCNIFKGSIRAEDIMSTLRVRFPEFRAIRGESLLFLDEIQMCRDARSALKPLVKYGKMDIVASGSSLSVMGLRNFSDPKSDSASLPKTRIERGSLGEDGVRITVTSEVDSKMLSETVLESRRKRVSPMGYEEFERMYPMDFEEYLWALGIDRETTDDIRRHIKDREPFNDTMLSTLETYFRQYVVIGGMPDAVLASLNPDGDPFRRIHDLRMEHIGDIGELASPDIRLNIEGCLASVGPRLGKTNKRFRYTDIEGRDNVGWREYADPIVWLGSSGLVSICHNVSEPVHPLMTRTGRDFKMYMGDTGMLLDTLGHGVRTAFHAGDYSVNEGGLAENAVANMIERCGLDLYYFGRDVVRPNGKRDRVDIDFMVDMDGELAAVEVKSGRKRSAPSLNKFIDNDEYRQYDVRRLIKLENANIFTDERGVEHYPLFAAAFMDSMFDRKAIAFVRDLPLGEDDNVS